MNFEACLALPHDPREAALIADNLAALARALRDWPVDAWLAVHTETKPEGSLFERLVARAAPAALDPRSKQAAMQSAEAVAGVLRVMWPTGPDEPASERDEQTSAFSAT